MTYRSFPGGELRLRADALPLEQESCHVSSLLRRIQITVDGGDRGAEQQHLELEGEDVWVVNSGLLRQPA